MNYHPFLGVAFAGLLVGFEACVPASALPGTSLGNYSVVGTLETNTCGSGIDANNPWDFTAQLSQDGTTLYLEDTVTSDQVSGGFDSTADTSATLVSAMTQNVTSASDTSGTSCNLTLTTTMPITLSSATSASTFTGTATYDYSVATTVSSNTDCTAQLSSAGGKYSTLPCTVTYSLKGTRQ
jgi:hypothetical protein